MGVNTALLVIDMQKFFESMTTRAIPNIKKLIGTFNATSSPVIFTQHGHSREELTADPPRNQLVRKWGASGSIAYGSSDWEFQKSLKTLSSVKEGTKWPKIVAKNTYDALINTDLAQILDEAQIERVVVCGVMTDCCCDTTARSAFNRGYETWLIGDACGSANSAQHQAGLRGFGFAFGEVLTTDEAISMLDEN